MHCHNMVYIRIVLTTLVIITCLLGDNFVELTQHPLLRALADNATHAVIGALTGIAYVVQFHERTGNVMGWFLIFICFAVSSLIDLDHFIEAHSWNLEDATNLTRRPFLHCSSIILIVIIFYVCTACLNYFETSMVLGVVLCAFITHHTRDAVRRGYWLYPFSHTERIPYVSYIIITVLVPHLLAHVHHICRTTIVQQCLGNYIKLNENHHRGSTTTTGYRYLNV